MNLIGLFLTLALQIVCDSQGARILGIFVTPFKSHYTYNHEIMKSLANAGHNVTVITPFPKDAEGKNITIIDVSKNAVTHVGRPSWREFVVMSPYHLLQKSIPNEMLMCKKVLELEELRSIINSNETQYDVLFIEIYAVSKCFQYLAEKMQVPVVGTVTLRSWLLLDRQISNPFNPSYIPLELLLRWDYNSFIGRLLNVWYTLHLDFFWYMEVSPFLKRFHKENEKILRSPAYLDINPSVTFFNSFPEYLPRPLNPSIIQIGGISVAEAKPLPKQLREWIEESEHGVILFALGSIARSDTLDPEILMAFKEAFAEIPQRVIWKFETELENIPSNVLVQDWVPQRDILAHENVVAFITHGGQGGIYEAIYSTKPMVSLPLMGDQITNTVLMERLGVAVGLDAYSVSKQKILNALSAVMSDEYRENMKRLSKTLKNRPMSPQESVVYWTEYVITHNGAPHLQTAATKLYWFQELLLDIISFALLVLAICIYMVYRVFKISYHFFCKLRCTEKRSKKNKTM